MTSFTSKAVAESFRMVVFEEERRKYRDKVKEIKGIKGVFADTDRQNQYVDNLLSSLQSYRKVKIE